MDFKEAVEYQKQNQPVTYKGHKYYVVGYNRILKIVTIREISADPLFTVPMDADPAELS